MNNCMNDQSLPSQLSKDMVCYFEGASVMIAYYHTQVPKLDAERQSKPSNF